jgi:hypothetical protein
VPDKAKKEALAKPSSYRPSAFYWRQDIRAARDLKTVKGYALALVEELEAHKQAIRDLGLMPPKTRLAPSEAKAKPHLVGDSQPEQP